MAFSAAKARPFRSLGLFKSAGKHAAPKGRGPESDSVGESATTHPHRPAHAATMPRLTGQNTGTEQAA
jgi:hypothetical protein